MSVPKVTVTITVQITDSIGSQTIVYAPEISPTAPAQLPARVERALEGGSDYVLEGVRRLTEPRRGDG